MPSAKPLPTVEDLRQAASRAVRGQVDRHANLRTGGGYDHTTSTMAVLFAREADQDQANFRAIYVDDASGTDLTRLIQGRWGFARILDTHGAGFCSFNRSTAAFGADTFWRGTRIQTPGAPPGTYRVSEDTVVPATATTVSVPIEAEATGVGVACSISSGLQLLDPVGDPLWTPTALVCADGTAFESADVYRARARQLRRAARNGLIERIQDVCMAAGASYVVAFASDYGLAVDDFDHDVGLNALYVADANFTAAESLLDACAIALEDARVLGADLWVGGIQEQALAPSAVLSLIDDPGKLPVVPIKRAAVQALLAYFSPTDAGYTYSLDGMAGVIRKAHPAITNATFVSPVSEPTLTAASGWPAVLTRYTVAARSITLTLQGPS